MITKITCEAQRMVKNINEYLRRYEDAEKTKMETHNDSDFERALRIQENAYWDIYTSFTCLLQELDILGLNAGVDDRLHYKHDIVDKKIFHDIEDN